MAKGRRNSQTQRLPSLKVNAQATTSSVTKRSTTHRIDDGPPIAPITPPKHVPIPDIPKIQEITFELFMLFFGLISLGLQYLNLYRTVFWLPQSYTKYAMHFHLIDVGLVCFIVTLLARRLVWSIVRVSITRIFHHSYWKISILIARILFTILLCIMLTFCFFSISSTFNLIRTIALFYPFTFYVFKFNMEPSAFFELIPSPVFSEEKGKNKNGKKVVIKPIHHMCISFPDGIRTEVNFLREDCNKRIAQVIFQTIMVVHYTAVVPCIFAPNSLYYDYFWVKINTFFVGASAFLWHMLYCFPVRYCDILHRSALHLGGWSRLESRASQVPFNTWTPTVLWPQGAHVKYMKEYYKAEGITNAAEPGNPTHARLFLLFSSPWKLQLALVVGFTSCSILHLAFLATLHQWQQVMATAIILAMTYAGLFILLRDYLILKKVYKYEQMQQSKTVS